MAPNEAVAVDGSRSHDGSTAESWHPQRLDVLGVQVVRAFWALRVPAPEEPGLVARGVSPWNADDRATEPQRGDSEPEVGARRDCLAQPPGFGVSIGGAHCMLAAVCRPCGALLFEDAVVQGLAPLATDRRPSGTSRCSNHQLKRVANRNNHLHVSRFTRNLWMTRSAIELRTGRLFKACRRGFLPPN